MMEWGGSSYRRTVHVIGVAAPVDIREYMRYNDKKPFLTSTLCLLCVDEELLTCGILILPESGIIYHLLFSPVSLASLIHNHLHIVLSTINLCVPEIVIILLKYQPCPASLLICHSSALNCSRLLFSTACQVWGELLSQLFQVTISSARTKYHPPNMMEVQLF